MKTPVGKLKNLIPQDIKNFYHYFQAIFALIKYGFPANKLKIIGVTGTKGKTTTCFLIYHILTKLGKKTGLITSINAKIGQKEYDTGFHVTNPDPLALNKFLKEMVLQECEYAVVEVSSHGIHQNRIAGIKFEVGVLTNIAPEHLDYHKTFEEYKRVKMSFINSAKHKVIAPKHTNLSILEGDFNNLDVEAALMVAVKLGIDRKKAISTLKSFDLPEGRMKRIPNNLGLHLYIDFAHTPDSLMAVLKHFRKKIKGKLITVFGCAGERDSSKRSKMGQISTELSDYSVFTAEDPRSEDINDILSEMVKGARKNKNSKEVDHKNLTTLNRQNKNTNIYMRIPERGEAITYAIQKLAKKGDTVVFCGKGHEKSMAYSGVEYQWDDKRAVELALKGKVLEINRPGL